MLETDIMKKIFSSIVKAVFLTGILSMVYSEDPESKSPYSFSLSSRVT